MTGNFVGADLNNDGFITGGSIPDPDAVLDPANPLFFPTIPLPQEVWRPYHSCATKEIGKDKPKNFLTIVQSERNLFANCVDLAAIRSTCHRSLILAVLLVMKVFGWELKFSGNSMFPEITLINSTTHSVSGWFRYNLDGEIGNVHMVLPGPPPPNLDTNSFDNVFVMLGTVVSSALVKTSCRV